MLGCITYGSIYVLQIFTGESIQPTKYGKGILRLASCEDGPVKPMGLSESFWRVLGPCLSYQPDARPTMSEVEIALNVERL